MARTFDGVDDIITASITAMDSGDWTLGCWFKATSIPAGGASSTSPAMLLTAQSGSEVQDVGLMNGTHVRAFQGRATTACSAESANATVGTGAWTCVVCTFLSTFTMKIFLGSLSAPMAEASYQNQVTGSGARNTGATNAGLGRWVGGNFNMYSGALARAFMDARLWTLDEMEAFRQGSLPVNTGSLRGFWPLDSPTATRAEDLSGNGANGTVTNGPTVSEDPPIPYGLVSARQVITPHAARRRPAPSSLVLLGV